VEHLSRIGSTEGRSYDGPQCKKRPAAASPRTPSSPRSALLVDDLRDIEDSWIELIRPSGTFSPTVEFCRVSPNRLWGRRIAVGGSTVSEGVPVKTISRDRLQSGVRAIRWRRKGFRDASKTNDCDSLLVEVDAGELHPPDGFKSWSFRDGSERCVANTVVVRSPARSHFPWRGSGFPCVVIRTDGTLSVVCHRLRQFCVCVFPFALA
jgi:hypothetical protein